MNFRPWRSTFRGEKAAQANRRFPGQAPTRDLEVGVPVDRLAEVVRAQLYADRDYARERRQAWQGYATATQILIWITGASATVILGLSDLSTCASIGFALTALVTLLNSVEPFFNWRSRWINCDEALAEWHEAEEALYLYVAATPREQLDRERILEFDQMRRNAWTRFSQQWLHERRGGGTAR